MQKASVQRHFRITVVLPNNKHKIVDVKASKLEVAERRALKRVPAAIDIHRS